MKLILARKRSNTQMFGEKTQILDIIIVNVDDTKITPHCGVAIS